MCEAAGTIDWTPAWALPNVMIAEPIEASEVALMDCRDERVQALVRRHPTFGNFIGRFQDEFGVQIWPTLLLFRSTAPTAVRTVSALGSFRDAICISAIASSSAHTICLRRPSGLPFSESFDTYPWFLGRDYDEHLYTRTPAALGMHAVDQLRGQSTPALGNRTLSAGDLDHVLLAGLLARWETNFARRIGAPEHRRLFRALDMARAASRMPGSVDSSHHDGGRAVALWVSAFEILVHDDHADLGRVLALLRRVRWESRDLNLYDRPVIAGRFRAETNLAGEVYAALNGVRNDFMHGNPVTTKTLLLPRSEQHMLRFAAPLFRLALTAYLDLYFVRDMPDMETDPKGFGRYISDRIKFMAPQLIAEEALRVADQPLQSRTRERGGDRDDAGPIQFRPAQP